MIWQMIKPFIPYLIIIILGGVIFLMIKKMSKMKIEHREEVQQVKRELAAEVLRNQEKQNQIDDLLNFRENDTERQKEMERHAEILRKAKTKEEVHNEMVEISNNIRGIFNS